LPWTCREITDPTLHRTPSLSSFVIGANVVSGGVKGGTWLLAGLVLGGTVGGAAAGPLWRALRLDPVRLLRSN